MATATALSTGHVTEVGTEAEWKDILSQAQEEDKTVVVDFSATWCGPCRMISPYFDELSKDFKSVYFLKVDVDAVEAVAAVAGVTAMPTFQVWHKGTKVDELVGASKEKLKAMIEKHSS